MRRRIAALLLLIFAVSSLSGCSKQDSFYDTSFFAMDTVVTLRLSRRSETGGRLAESVLRTAAAEAEKIICGYEKKRPVTLRVNTVKSSAGEVLEALAAAGISAKGVSYKVLVK